MFFHFSLSKKVVDIFLGSKKGKQQIVILKIYLALGSLRPGFFVVHYSLSNLHFCALCAVSHLPIDHNPR